MRTVSGDYAARLIATATAPRYLLSIALSGVVRLSTHASANGSPISFGGFNWVQSSFDVNYTPGVTPAGDAATISIKNHDGVIGGLLLSDAAAFPACEIGIYFYDGDDGVANAIRIMGNSVGDVFTLTPEAAHIVVTTKAKMTIRLPSTRIAINSVRQTITPEGTSVTWNGECFEFRN